jgi:hypothetical protein
VSPGIEHAAAIEEVAEVFALAVARIAEEGWDPKRDAGSASPAIIW